MGNPDLGGAVTDFMAILQFIDYSKFKRFFNLADKIFINLLSSFLVCEVLAVVPDQYDFEFSIKAAERKHLTEDAAHIQETEIIDNRKVIKSFQSYLGNSNNKTNLVKYLFPKMERNIAKRFNLLSNHLSGKS